MFKHKLVFYICSFALWLVLVTVCGLIFRGTNGGIMDIIVADLLEKSRPSLASMLLGNVQSETIILTNVSINGLENFEVTELNVFWFQINNLTIELPYVEIEAIYLMDRFYVPGTLYLSGAGSARIQMFGLKCFIEANVKRSHGRYMMHQIQDLMARVQRMHVQLFIPTQSEASNYVINVVLNRVATIFFNDWATKVLTSNKDEVGEIINRFLQNKQLQ